MTAPPRNANETAAHARRWLGMLALVALMLAAPSHAEDRVKGDVKVFTDGGYVRLRFKFDEELPATIKLSWPILVVEFKKPVKLAAVDRLNASAPGVISAARIDPDGTAVRIALAQQVKLNSIPAAERLYVDLLPPQWSGVLPGLPQEVVDELASRAREAERQLHRVQATVKPPPPPTIRVKVATQPTFTRFIFDLPPAMNVTPARDDDKLTLTFDRPVKWDLDDAAAALPATLQKIDTNMDVDQATVVFALNGTPELRSFREDQTYVVDVGHDGAKPKDTVEEGEVKQPADAPAIAAPATVPAQDVQPAPTADAAPKMTDVPPPSADAAPKMTEVAPPPAAPAAPAGAAPAALPKIADVPPPKAAPPAQALPKIAAVPPKPPAEPPSKLAAEPMPPKAAAEPAPKPAPEAAPSAPPPAPAKSEAAPAKNDKSDEQSAAPTPPRADGPVVVGLHRGGDLLRLEFPFVAPTPAAAFTRADMVWLVFDSNAKIDIGALTREHDDAIRSATLRRGADGEAIVRIQLKRPQLVSLDNDGPAWMVAIGDTVTVPTRPLAVARSVVGKNRSNIVIPFEQPGKFHRITDNEAGDRLLVVTALGPARGFLRPQDYVELRTLTSAHGVVVHPIADDVTVELTADKITLTRPGGLSLSSSTVGEQEATTNFRNLTFDTQLWGFDRKAPYQERQSELIRLAADAPPPRRRQARLNLARFYLARDMAAEAKAVLDVALDSQNGGEDVTGSVLRAVANVMLHRPDDALKELLKPQVGNQLDAPVWRAVAFAKQGKWADARDGFQNLDATVAGLPVELQRMTMMEALRTAIELRDFTRAARLVNELETLGVSHKLEPAYAVLVGKLNEELGRTDDALNSYHSAAESDDRRAAAQGRLREIALHLALKDMPRKDAIAGLETLTTIWRGDETEAEGLKVLAHLYTEQGRYRDAFHVMRSALLAHPNSNMTRKIQDEAAASFESLFLSAQGDKLPAIEALGLFYDYRELTPIGRRGDEMIRRLADRLVKVDLLDQAAELLQHQVDHRLQGAARAQVATKLAVIYLMNHKADRALATLQSTRTAGLADELREQRLLLEARALSDVGRHDLALEVIANLASHEAMRLRADILWAAKRWRRAGEQIELMEGERWKQFEPLSEGERFDVLRGAVAYALADESIGLARFRDKYAAKMAQGPDAHAFEVVSAPIGSMSDEFQDIARHIAGSNTLDAFLADMRKRYPDAPGGDSTQNDTGEAPPAPPAASPAPPAAPPKPQANVPPAPVPTGVPLKPDPAPTGSIRRR